MDNNSKIKGDMVEPSKCIKCGNNYDAADVSPEDEKSCSSYQINNYCQKCRPKLTLAEKAFGYTYVAGGISWITARELALKPTIRGFRKIFKGLNNWTDK